MPGITTFRALEFVDHTAKFSLQSLHVRLCLVRIERMDQSELPVGEPFPTPEMDSNGVDRSQIRSSLALTPFERLKAVEAFLASTVRIRRGLRRTSISPDPVSPR